MPLGLPSLLANSPFVAETEIAFADRLCAAKTKIIQKPRPKQLGLVIPTRPSRIRVEVQQIVYAVV